MKPEEVIILVQRRLEQAQEALEDAKFLLDGNRSTQSIVNRSYYAMFYAVLALLQQIGRVPSKHTGVIGLFDTEFVVKGLLPKELSKNLHKAFERRQISDYQASERISAEEAESVLNHAIQFVESIKKYLIQQCPDCEMTQ